MLAIANRTSRAEFGAALRFRRAVGNGIVDGVVQLRHSRALEQQMQLQRPAVVVLLRIELALQLHRQPH